MEKDAKFDDDNTEQTEPLLGLTPFSETTTRDTYKKKGEDRYILGIKVKKETSAANLFSIFYITFIMAAKYGFLQI